MKPLLAVLAIPTALAAFGPAGAVPGGEIGVLPKGLYVCELPGNAGDPFSAAGVHQPEYDFEVVGDSGYRVGRERGTYLRTGDETVMTNGPQRGRRYRVVSDNYLRIIAADGTETTMRCVRTPQPIAPEPDETHKSGQCRPDAGGSPVALGTGSDKPKC